MIIRNISLENFRNYGRLDLDVGPSVNIVCGNNAQGKTNLVEAISVCSCITSHRTSKDRDLIKSGESGYKICLEFDGSGYYGSVASLENQYLTERSPLNNSGKPRRQLKIDGLLTTHTNEYLGHCNTVIFAPEDLNIVKGAPQHRRKFLNMLISKVSPSYYDLIARMNRCIIQKTALIKSYRGNDAYIRNDDFDFWDITMADLSSEIIIKRMRFVNMISKKASEHHSVISDGREVLSVSYVGMPFYREIEDHLKEKGLIEGFYAENMDENVYLEVKKLIDSYLRAAFRKSRKNDIEKGICTIGIHRDGHEDILLSGAAKVCGACAEACRTRDTKETLSFLSCPSSG